MINHKSNGNFKSHITFEWTQEGLVALLALKLSKLLVWDWVYGPIYWISGLWKREEKLSKINNNHNFINEPQNTKIHKSCTRMVHSSYLTWKIGHLVLNQFPPLWKSLVLSPRKNSLLETSFEFSSLLLLSFFWNLHLLVLSFCPSECVLLLSSSSAFSCLFSATYLGQLHPYWSSFILIITIYQVSFNLISTPPFSQASALLFSTFLSFILYHTSPIILLSCPFCSPSWRMHHLKTWNLW